MMANAMRLYSGPLSMFGAKAQIAALEKGLAFELIMVPYETAYEPKHAEVVRINPKRQVPVLTHGDVEIFDSTQIFEYFEDLQPDPPLWPRATAARAYARLLELKSDEVYFPHIIRLMGLQKQPDDPPRWQREPAPRSSTAQWSRSSSIGSSLATPIRSRISPSTWRMCSAPVWARR